MRGLLLACLLVFIAAFSGTGCSTLKQLQNTASGLLKLQFRLDGVEPGSLAGVDLAKAAHPEALGVLDAVKLAEAYSTGSWPLVFDLKVAVKNPNEGDGEGASTAVLQALDWTLSIDGRETITGGIPEPLRIPGDGETTVFPVRMSIDLFSYFSDRGFDDVLGLALAIAGKEGTASRITLTAVPTVSIGGVPIRYPAAITIVDTEFSNP